MKKLFFIIIAIVIVITVAVVSIPYLLNSPMGREAIVSRMRQKTKYALQVDTMHFTWLGPQRAEGVIATSPKGIEYHFPQVSLETPLWELWKKTPSIGLTRIVNSTATPPQPNEKPIEENESLDPITPTHKKRSQTHCAIFGEIHVVDGKIYCNSDPIDIPKLQYQCTKEGMTVHMDAKFPHATEISHLDIEHKNGSQNFQLQGREIPSHLFDTLGLWNEFSILEVIGATFNINSSAQLIHSSGPVLLDIDSPNLSIAQSGEIHCDRYLLDHCTVSLRITKKMVDSLFHHPILQIDPIKDPITAAIQPQEIPLPLSTSTEIKNGSIHIGTITCRNTDLLFQLATELLQIDSPKIDIWFSEIPVHYANGILRMDRFKLLLQNEYPIALWGKIDFFQKKVNLTLAITETALKKAFGIKSLPPDFVITCPIKGNFGDVRLDVTKLIKRLSVLLAKEKAKKQLWKKGSNIP